jgi:DNA-binding LacI/PurR family transcriptional regulator
MKEMGRMAMEMLSKLLSGSQEPMQIRVPGELLLRETTSPPAAAQES